MKFEDVKLVVGIPTGNHQIDIDILLHWDRIDLPKRRKIITSTSPYIDANRNDMIQFALSGHLDKSLGGSFTHFLMWDSDSLPIHVDTVRALFDADKDIVYAVAASKTVVSLWMVFEWTNVEHARHAWIQISDPWEPYNIFPKYRNKVFEVAGGGKGMCLIKLEVFEKVPKPWYRSYYNDVVEFVGDDVAFHKKMYEHGIKIHPHGGKFCQHRPGKHLWPDVIAKAAEMSISYDGPRAIEEMKQRGRE